MMTDSSLHPPLFVFHCQPYHVTVFIPYTTYQNKTYHFTSNRFPYPAQNAVIEKFVNTGSGPAGIAIDSENGHVYWTEYQSNRLMRCSVARSNEVHITTLTSPFSVRIDVLNRYISYTTLEHNDIKSAKHTYLGTCVVVKTDLMTCPSCSYVI